MSQRKSALKFAVSVNNFDYPASLEHKIYRISPDQDAAIDGDLRVIDEGGADYLFPAAGLSLSSCHLRSSDPCGERPGIHRADTEC